MASERTVAVDVGSGLTKGTDGDRRELLASVAVRARPDGRYGGDRAKPVSWRDGERWLVAEDAIAFGDAQAYANTCSEQWAGSDGWRALLYAMLGRLDVSGRATLVTGVPMAWYHDLAEPLRKALKGHHRFFYGSTLIEVELEPLVVPQAVGALYYHTGKVGEMPAKSANIDCGTYTSGYSAIYRDRPIISACGGIALGTSVIAAGLADYLKREYHYVTDLLTYHEVLQSGTVEVRGRKVSIKPVLRDLTLLLARPLLEALERSWPNRDEMAVYVGGGGADLFLPAIRHLIPHAQKMDGGIWSVAEGMYLLATIRQE
jgi:hypothetical protein